MNKRSVAKLMKQIEAEKAKITASRDKLRDLISEVSDICDDCDEAAEGLERATDALSKYL